MRSEVDSVVATVETRVHDAILTSKESSVIPRVAMKSVKASSGWEIDSVVFDPDQREFSGNIKGSEVE